VRVERWDPMMVDSMALSTDKQMAALWVYMMAVWLVTKMDFEMVEWMDYRKVG